MAFHKPSYVRESGFRGGVRINVDGTSAWLLATSGNVQCQKTRPSSSAIDMPPPIGNSGANPRSEFLVALGTEVYSGSMSFDMTLGAMPCIKKLIKKRGVAFSLEFVVPESQDSARPVGERISYCYMQSLSLSGAQDGAITGSLNFVSIDELDGINVGSFTHKDVLAGASYERPQLYWYSGGSSENDIRDWSLNVSQDVKPMFGNVSGTLPIYARFGTLKYELTVNTYFEVKKLMEVNICGNDFTLQGVTSSQTSNYTPGEPVTATHVFAGYNRLSEGVDGAVISIG